MAYYGAVQLFIESKENLYIALEDDVLNKLMDETQL